MSKTFMLKLASAIVVNGQPVAAGNVVEVGEATAKRLLDAGKADLATAEDVYPVEPQEPVEPVTAKGGKAKGEAK